MAKQNRDEPAAEYTPREALYAPLPDELELDNGVEEIKNRIFIIKLEQGGTASVQ